MGFAKNQQDSWRLPNSDKVYSIIIDKNCSDKMHKIDRTMYQMNQWKSVCGTPFLTSKLEHPTQKWDTNWKVRLWMPSQWVYNLGRIWVHTLLK